MKLRVILSLIVVLFIGQSMCAMSTQILRRPIVLDGELIDNGTRSINPLIPISADIDGTMWRANLCATFLGNLVYPTPASKMLHFP